MSDIENAIRKKLSQVDFNNASARRQVYETIWNAHEQFLISNANLNDDDRNRRRNNLTTVIKNIEQSFHTAQEQTPKAQAPQPFPEAPSAQRVEQNVQNSASLYPDAIHPSSARTFQKPEKINGKNLTKILLALIIVVVLAIAGWLFITGKLGGIFSSGSNKNTVNQQSSAPNSPQQQTPTQASQTQTNTSQDYDTSPAIQTQRPPDEETRPLSQDLRSDDEKRSSEGWARVFTPNDVAGFEVKGGAKAQIINTDGDSYLHISSQSIDDAAIINIGSGALNDLRGHKVTVDIVARSNTSTPSQLIVTCDFGGKVECGRTRFEVPPTRDDLLINVTLPAKSTSPGKIYLTSDYLKKDQSIDIYRVFIRKAD